MPTLKVRFLTLTLAAMSLINSSFAFAQVQENKLMEEPKKKVDKIDLLYRSSNIYFLGGTMLDSISTARLMDHPTLALRTDNSVLTHYYGVETGWASCFGKRNEIAAVAANSILNAGIGLASRNLYRRGGHWRTVAIALNVLKGTDSVVAGIHNVRFNADVDRKVQLATGYNGRIVWSH